MKKTLLLLTGLFLSILSSWAQYYTVNPNGIKNVEDLKAGDYVIYATPNSTEKVPGYVAYKESGNDPVLIKTLNLTDGVVKDNHFVWTVEKNSDGQFSIVLKSDATKFWTKDTQWNQNMHGTEKAYLVGEDNDNGQAAGISFCLPEPINTNGENGGSPTTSLAYIYCNGTGTTGVSRLSYWEVKSGAVTFAFYPVTETAYPFKLSDGPTADGFAENTYWYYMKINSKASDSAPKYAFYTETDNEDNQINLNTTNPVNYGSFWAFVQTADGKIKIYNAGAGIDKALTLSDDDGGKGAGIKMLKMLDASSNVNNTWEKTNSGRGSNYIQFKSSDANYYINMTDKGNILFGKDGATGDWSDLMFESVSLSSVITSAKENETAVQGAVGSLSSNDYTAFTAALEKGTMEGLIEALRIKNQTGKRITIEPNRYYRLESVYSRGKYMEMQSASATASALNKANASQIWQFSATDATHYTLSAQGAYAIAATAASTAITTTTESAEASQFVLTARTTTAQFGLTPSSGLELHYNGGANIIGWNNGNGSSWYIIAATDIDATIGETGYATVNYPFAVQVPEGVTAYTGTVNAEKGVFTLSEVANGIVPANTPVVLKGTPNTYTLTILPKDTEISEVAKSLSGTLLSEEIGGTTNAYILANGNSGIGFYQMNADDRTLGANKAYLELPAEVSNVRSIIFSDGQTTGIESTVAEGAETEEYYDLQGRRVMNPTKGIYVTKSGKKVLINK